MLICDMAQNFIAINKLCQTKVQNPLMHLDFIYNLLISIHIHLRSKEFLFTSITFYHQTLNSDKSTVVISGEVGTRNLRIGVMTTIAHLNPLLPDHSVTILFPPSFTQNGSLKIAITKRLKIAVKGPLFYADLCVSSMRACE